MRQRLALALLVLGASFLVPACTHAQWRVGAGLGYEFDLTDGWLHLGVDARYAMPTSNFEINPRLLFNPGDGYSSTQADVNLLYKIALANAKRIVPYAGAGLLVQRFSIKSSGQFKGSSETKVGVNLLAGARLNTTSSLSPFATAAYSVIREQGNNMVILAGAHWSPSK